MTCDMLCTQPVALVASAKQDRLFRDMWALEPVLRKASESYAAGQPPDMTVMYQLSQAQSALAAQSSVFKKYILFLCSLCLAWSAIIGIVSHKQNSSIQYTCPTASVYLNR